MDQHDKEFEAFLREFEPRRPRALPASSVSKSVWISRVAAAVLLTLTFGTSFWLVRHKQTLGKDGNRAQIRLLPSENTVDQVPLRLLPLTRLALEDPAQFDTTLTNASRQMLPDFHEKESTLRVLAKE